jgi:hypothetical protein
MVAYAIRSQYPDSYVYRRTVSQTNGSVGDWSVFSSTRATDYRQAGLNTPYSDELTAALTFPAPFDGHFRVKGVYRQNKDVFANTDKTTEKKTNVVGKQVTTTVSNLTNDGRSDYKGLALEWDARYQHHSFNANVLWSETKTFGSGTTYFSYDDPEELIYYQGDVIDMNELYDINARSNYAAPLKASIGWTSKWTERWMTNFTWNYRGSYSYIGNSDKQIDISGTKYDIYEQSTLPSFVTVNFNTRYTFFKHQNQSASVDVRVTNLFNTIPLVESTSSSTSYRLGRSVWLGVNYTY